MKKYIGCTINIVYLDRHGQFSQRRIRVSAVGVEKILAYDLDRRAPRVFRVDNILAMQQVRSA